MNVDSSAIGLVFLPLALVDIAITVDESASALCLVLLPVAFILRPVWPDLQASAMALTSARRPLALVAGIILQNLDLSVLERLVIQTGTGGPDGVVELSELFLYFFDSRV